MAQADRVLRLQDVSVAYDGQPALRGVDLELRRGETLCLLGASGSGKSTLLRVVAGLVAPQQGRVLLDGRDVTTHEVHRRGVGLQFQDFALFPHLDVAGNVGFGLRMRGVPADARDERVAQVLRLVGLPGYAGRDVAELSGGEQQRVALARALAPQPSVLLLDEPLGSLDRALRERLVLELAALFSELGQSVVSVTHDVQEAFALADRLAVLDDGVLVQVGTARQLWRRPATAAVARLLGFENMAEVELRDGIAHTPWGRLPAPAGADGRHLVVLRPDGLRPDPQGPVCGDVRQVTFAGDHDVVRIATSGGLLQVFARWSVAPEVGDRVRLVVSEDAVIALDSSSDRPDRPIPGQGKGAVHGA